MEMAEFLLKEGANVNVTDQDQRSAGDQVYYESLVLLAFLYAYLHCVVLQCLTIPYEALPYISLWYIALHYLRLLFALFSSFRLAAASSPPERR